MPSPALSTYAARRAVRAVALVQPFSTGGWTTLRMVRSSWWQRKQVSFIVAFASSFGWSEVCGAWQTAQSPTVTALCGNLSLSLRAWQP